jgi:hypothetical protein
MADLNEVIGSDPGIILDDAVDINDAGQIVAKNTLAHVFLLTPVPEPSTMCLLFIGLIGLFYIKFMANHN